MITLVFSPNQHLPKNMQHSVYVGKLRKSRVYLQTAFSGYIWLESSYFDQYLDLPQCQNFQKWVCPNLIFLQKKWCSFHQKRSHRCWKVGEIPKSVKYFINTSQIQMRNPKSKNYQQVYCLNIFQPIELQNSSAQLRWGAWK